MELVLAIVAILGGIAALFAVCAGIAAAWRWWKQPGKSAAAPVATDAADPPTSAPPVTPPPATAAPSKAEPEPIPAPTAATVSPAAGQYDVFLSYSHVDAELVEELARRLEAEGKFTAWLDQWVLIPGDRWQQAIAKGLNEAKCCAVCIGEETPDGWFREEIEMALNRQAADPCFRVFAVLLPDAKEVNVGDFLRQRTWVDFRKGFGDKWEFQGLVCGIQGVSRPRGAGGGPESPDTVPPDVRRPLEQIQQLFKEGLFFEAVAIDGQRRCLDKLIEGGGNDA